MPSTDWGRVDNLPYKPAGEFAKYVSDYSQGIAKGLEASMQSNVGAGNAATGGAKKSVAYKKTDKKVKVGNRDHCIYVGPRGGKYVKMNGKYRSLSDVKK